MRCNGSRGSVAGSKRRPLLTYFGEAPVPAARSRIMSSIRGKDSAPERTLRKEVWRRGGRYRCHVKGLPGTPDMANRTAKVAVFIDGCFWHGCPQHFRLPKTRSAFWREKIRRNRLNRKKHLAAYAPGWRVLQVYECRLRSDLDAVAAQVAALLTRDAPARASR